MTNKTINKYINTLFIVMIAMVIGISEIRAYTVIPGVDSAGDETSVACTSALCMKRISFSGIKVSIVDKTGKIIAGKNGKKVVNFWNSKKASDFVKNKKSGLTRNAKNENNTFGGAVPANSKQYTSYCNKKTKKCGITFKPYYYYVYNNEFTSNNVYIEGILPEGIIYSYSKIINDLSEANISSILSNGFGYTLGEVYKKGYFLKIEPVYVMNEMFFANSKYSRSNYFIGTSDYMLKFTQNDYTKGKTAMYYFYIGGQTKNIIPGSTVIGGAWNGIRNWIVNPYYPCGLFEGVSFACVSKTNEAKLSTYKSTTSTKICTYNKSKKKCECPLYDLYKGNNGLGVGYLSIDEVIEKRKIVIEKEYIPYMDPVGTKFSITNGSKEYSCTIESGNSCTIVILEPELSNLNFTIKETPKTEATSVDCRYGTKGTEQVCGAVSGEKYTKTFIFADDIKIVIKNKVNSDHKLTIKKIDKTSRKNITASAEFKLYTGSGCADGNEYDPYPYTRTTSGGMIDYGTVPSGQYSIRETKAPLGYKAPAPNNCTNFEVSGSTDTGVVIENEKNNNCIEDFNSLKASGKQNDIKERYNLYLAYYEDDYNNLLNLGITKPEVACSHTSCGLEGTTKCLYGEISPKYSEIVKQDGTIISNPGYACYNDVITDSSGNISGICNVSFKFTNPIGAEADDFVFTAKRGLAFTDTDIAGTGVLTTDCVSVNNLSFTYDEDKAIERFSKTLGDVNLEYSEFNNVDDPESIEVKTNTITSTEINYTIESKFKYVKTYVEIGSNGRLFYVPCMNCYQNKFFMSSASDTVADGVKSSMPFKISIDLFHGEGSYNGAYSSTHVSDESSCKYVLTSELIPEPDPNPKSLDIEFRTIDTSDPFPGQDGNGRKIGSNWNGYCFPDENDPTKCDEIANKIIMERVEANGGVLDAGVARSLTGYYATLALRGAVGFDTLEYRYIKNAPSSYGRDGAGNPVKPEYTITLTPSDIKLIRKYNSKTTYSDYYSTCLETDDDDSYTEDECKQHSRFVANLKNKDLIIEDGVYGSFSSRGSLSHPLEVKTN